MPQVTGASKVNIVSVCDGDFQLGFSQNDTIFYAYNGDKDQFEGETFDNFYAIGALYPEAVQLVVAADSDIKGITDLKGRKHPSARKAPAPPSTLSKSWNWRG